MQFGGLINDTINVLVSWWWRTSKVLHELWTVKNPTYGTISILHRRSVQHFWRIVQIVPVHPDQRFCPQKLNEEIAKLVRNCMFLRTLHAKNTFCMGDEGFQWLACWKKPQLPTPWTSQKRASFEWRRLGIIGFLSSMLSWGPAKSWWMLLGG